MRVGFMEKGFCSPYTQARMRTDSRVNAMRKWLPAIMTFLGMTLVSSCGDSGIQTAGLYRAPAISNEIGGVVFEAGNWEPHLGAGEEGVSWGNHRAVVVLEAAEVASAESQ